mgnify:CR=1 FL=1
MGILYFILGAYCAICWTISIFAYSEETASKQWIYIPLSPFIVLAVIVITGFEIILGKLK